MPEKHANALAAAQRRIVPWKASYRPASDAHFVMPR